MGALPDIFYPNFDWRKDITWSYLKLNEGFKFDDLLDTAKWTPLEKEIDIMTVTSVIQKMNDSKSYQMQM